MKRMSVLCLLALSVTMVAGCQKNTEDSEFVESGFTFASGHNNLSPWLPTAVKAKRKQEAIVSFLVYAGYESGFIEKWNSDAFDSNPGYGTFALKRSIRDKTNTEISFFYLDLPNFDDESKYVVRTQGADGSPDKIISRKYTFSTTDTFDLDEITIEQGCIMYFICVLDNNNQDIGNLNCGTGAGSLYFVKSGNQIMFSYYQNIFDEYKENR